jgi:hypothetical protein
MASWQLRYRVSGSTYGTVFQGPDPAGALGAFFGLQAKKAMLDCAERLNMSSDGQPQAMRRCISEILPYGCVGGGGSLTTTTFQLVMSNLGALGGKEDYNPYPIKNNPGAGAEDRGNVTLTNGVPSAVTERKEWRVELL